MFYNIFMLNEKLKKLRKNKRKSQKQIADMLGITQTAYSRYEVGISEPNIETLLKLADYFNVDLDYLMRNDETKSNENNIDNELQPNQIITIGRSGKKEIYELDEEDK